jgi:hypothetical protein
MKTLSRKSSFIVLAIVSLMAHAALGQTTTNLDSSSLTNSASDTNDVLLLDNLGRVVTVPTNEVPSGYRPPKNVGVNDQIPTLTRGAMTPSVVLQRARKAISHAEFFPTVPPALMPYLSSQDEYGNTAISPGPLIHNAPDEVWVEKAKYELSTLGFRYSLQQTFTYLSLSDVKQGSDVLGLYTFNLKSKWAIFTVPGATAGWVSSQVAAQSGLTPASQTESPRANLGTLTSPSGIWSSVNGFRIPELAWQESLFNGHVVAVAGMVSQRNYMDDNAYANSGRSKFMNSALINSQVLPLGRYNFGYNLQWQPLDDWYGMIGGNAGNGSAGVQPWANFSWNKWSIPAEVGYAPQDVYGLGPGIYRVQPFVAGANGTTGGGVCFDMQQKLGPDSPYGWFGRFGFGNSKVSGTADNQIGTGFVAQGPFRHLLFNRTSNDFLGTGFVWSQPSATTKTIYHENEFVWETVYAIQLTHLIKLEPDFQMIWNPVFHNVNRASAFQLQLAMSW